MKIGKVPNSVLKRIIFDKIIKSRSDVVLKPGIGEDCSAIEFGDLLCVLSSDPITGTAREIGRLAVHINCNDIASCGVEPIGLLTTLLCPPGTKETELETIIDQIIKNAEAMDVGILGGHTEVTDAVERFVISCTAIGRCVRGELITTSGARDADSLVLTKHAGLEGASIIAHEKEKELFNVLGAEYLQEAKAYMDELSVVKEGLAAARFGVNAMHDVTEGGVFGAVWEMCEASGLGAVIRTGKIPVRKPTIGICRHYNINPYRLISSGCMLISTNNGEELVRHLDTNGIEATVIGSMNKSQERIALYGEKEERIMAPEADELYKVLGR